MFGRRNSFRTARYLPFFLMLSACAAVSAQTPTPSPTPAPAKSQDEVVRVYTELVQTDVMVFDKQGHFVDGLTKDNFELRIDGKPRSLSLIHISEPTRRS